jgi:hypothetical protein
MTSASMADSNPALPRGCGGGVLEDWPGRGERQKLAPFGGHYPTGGGGGHVKGCPATGDPPHNIICAWLLSEPCIRKDWLMLNNLNSDFEKKDKFTYELSKAYRMENLHMGLIDHPVRWDEEMMEAYRMENSHIARIMLIVSYVVKQYLKLDKLQMLRQWLVSSIRCTAGFALGYESIHPDVLIFPLF